VHASWHTPPTHTDEETPRLSTQSCVIWHDCEQMPWAGKHVRFSAQSSVVPHGSEYRLFGASSSPPHELTTGASSRIMLAMRFTALRRIVFAMNGDVRRAAGANDTPKRANAPASNRSCERSEIVKGWGPMGFAQRAGTPGL
jgi:hypothetical protein